MEEKSETYVNMQGELVERKVLTENNSSPDSKNKPSKKLIMTSFAILLLYVLFWKLSYLYPNTYWQNVPIFTYIDMFLGISLLFFSYKIFPIINKNRNLVLFLMYTFFGAIELFKLIYIVMFWIGANVFNSCAGGC